MFKTILLSFAALIASVASANPITFIHSGSGTGSIGDIDFTDAAFTITSEGDTGNREAYDGGFFIDHFTSIIDIDGVGLFTFVTSTRTFINDNSDTVGFSRAGTNGADLFNGPSNAAFDGWDMMTSIGPVLGTGFLLQWTLIDVFTDQGLLVFTDGSSDASFQAIVHDVPTPATAALLAFAGLLLLRRKAR